MNELTNGFEHLRKLQDQDEKKPKFSEFEKYLSLKAREKGVPVSGTFELTPLCNFNCKMCYVHLNIDQLHGRDVLSVNTWKDLIYQAWKAGLITATLTGGECLTYPGFDELFLFLHSLGCEVAVFTNGYLLDEKRIQFFREHLPAMIQITLYGCNDDVYERVTGQRAFTTVVTNIKRAIEAGLPVCVSITPNKYLGEELLETIRIAKELCKTVIVNSFFTTPRQETGRSGQQDDAELDLYIRAFKYIDQLEGRETVEIEERDLPPCGGSSCTASDCGLKCGGGRSNFSIDWKGTLKPCVDLERIQAYPLKEGFAAAWTKVNQEANNWPRVPECEGCPYDAVCNACAAYMLRYADPGKLPTGLCEQTRKFVCSGVKHIPTCE